MKKTLSFILSILLLPSATFAFASCDNSNANSSDNASQISASNGESTDNNQPEAPDDNKTPVATLGKLEGTVIYCTAFSEGLAFAVIKEDSESLYCINEAGEVVFKSENVIWTNLMYEAPIGFHNGLAYLGKNVFDGGICDLTGKITRPADVGVSKFHAFALEGGYIIADINDDEGKLIKRGIMNTSFEWVVQPNEQLTGLYLYPSGSIYSNDTLYLPVIDSCALNLKTGETVDFEDFDELPSELWSFRPIYDNGDLPEYFICYKDDKGEKEAFRFTETENIYEGSAFAHGYAPVYYYNESTQLYSFTMIDTKGEILFAPIEIGNIYTEVVWDGECIVVHKEGDYSQADVFTSYNFNGKLLGSVNCFGIYERKMTWSLIGIQDGMIVIYAERGGGYGMTSNLAYAYDKEMNLILGFDE